MMLNSGDTANLAEALEQANPSVIMESLKNAVPGLISLGTHLLIAILIFFVGRKVNRMLVGMLKRSLERLAVETGLSHFLLSVANALLYAVLVLMIADYIGVESTSIVTIFGSAGLALGLALQGSLANFAGGVLILLMKPFKVGDYIVTDSGEGTVQDIGLVYTTLATPDNKIVVLPNGTLSNSPLTNATAMDKRRLDITVSISYDSDLRKAKKIIGEILEGQSCYLKEEGITLLVDSLTDSGVIVGGRIWVPASEYWNVRWEVLERVKLEFEDNGIKIPASQMDVRITKEDAKKNG
ncbi:MAG: mechanosensitive ion channel family protein [bacterium]|nr:mechanosensitive ion channel family protein [bacterium]